MITRPRRSSVALAAGFALVLSGCASMSGSDSDSMDMETDTDMEMQSDDMMVEDMSMDMQESFTEYDTNGDGMVSRDEVLEADGELGDNWGAADLNGDDQLSPAEFGTYDAE